MYHLLSSLQTVCFRRSLGNLLGIVLVFASKAQDIFTFVSLRVTASWQGFNSLKQSFSHGRNDDRSQKKNSCACVWISDNHRFISRVLTISREGREAERFLTELALKLALKLSQKQMHYCIRILWLKAKLSLTYYDQQF